jgi:hypothetical protein
MGAAPTYLVGNKVRAIFTITIHIVAIIMAGFLIITLHILISSLTRTILVGRAISTTTTAAETTHCQDAFTP